LKHKNEAEFLNGGKAKGGGTALYGAFKKNRDMKSYLEFLLIVRKGIFYFANSFK